MKNSIYLFALIFLFACQEDPITPTPTPPAPGNGIDGDWQEAYSQYITYDCATDQMTNESSSIYITPMGNTSSKIRFNQGTIYSVYDQTQNAMGTYTTQYLVFNSNLNDTFYITSITSTKMVAETFTPEQPCSEYTNTRFTFLK